MRLASAEGVAEAMGGAKNAHDDVWGMTFATSRGGFVDFGSMNEVGGLPCGELAKAQAGFHGWAVSWSARRSVVVVVVAECVVVVVAECVVVVVVTSGVLFECMRVRMRVRTVRVCVCV